MRAWPPCDCAPHELSFGIIRDDGSEKPVARVLKAFADENRHAIAPPPPIVDAESWFAALPDGVKATYDAYASSHG